MECTYTNTACIFQKKPTFHWELQAHVRFPMVAYKNSHTLRMSKTGREARSQPKTSLVVFLEIFSTLTLTEGNSRHLHLQGQDSCGIKLKR